MKTIPFILLILSAFVGSSFAGSKVAAGIEAAAPSVRDAAWQTSEKAVKALLKKGALHKIDPQRKKAWVDSLTWLMLDADHKEKLARLLAVYCLPLYPEVDILDSRSGRKLASYGPIQGFKVY